MPATERDARGDDRHHRQGVDLPHAERRVLRARRGPVCRWLHPDADTNDDSNAHTDSDPATGRWWADADRHADEPWRWRNAESDPDRYPDADGNRDGYTDPGADGHTDEPRGRRNIESDPDRHTHPIPDSDADHWRRDSDPDRACDDDRRREQWE